MRVDVVLVDIGAILAVAWIIWYFWIVGRKTG
jgi:hypothetical protein